VKAWPCGSEWRPRHRHYPLDRPHPDPADLQETLALLAEQADWLVVDGYHFDRPISEPCGQEAIGSW